ncbi:anthranilate synthase family protein [Actinoplanes teichomyceticus]|uniref:anthranilate synthase n=1 Tax=Actinoplanes teichomyceticus TaxID=1867 RepID=A0A561WK58_ACTTI|nr:anthranilate synthase family protein [Actinoplanes teichomyceticus]TWG24213.1 phenazine biosynthesis protein phzE [Actinoplanes teichomyceticus]GIF12940.1 phenazine-specific anthranilate synthase component I [Actinoplanes teichomyceticus]
MTGHDLLRRVLAGREPAYALLHRPESAAAGDLEILLGELSEVDSLDDLPVPSAPGGRRGHEVLALIPYRQVRERGYLAPDDGAPLLAMAVREQGAVPLTEALSGIEDVSVTLHDARFEPDDAGYAATVRRVIDEEIGRGEGANFVIKRSFRADIGGHTPGAALAFFRRLVAGEQGAYWTFLVHTPERILVGATPERHLSLAGGVAAMNPVSGTYRYPGSGPDLRSLLEFLADGKESDELYMVLDEELKMMARICDDVRATGPGLKEMARLAHTEYHITGRTGRDVREILRETLFAPTVTGSPVENACRVIDRHEPEGRGYYSGVAALIGRDAAGGRLLDSAVLIRTADIDRAGHLRIDVGATLVRHSDPHAEVAETRAKAAGLLAALKPRNRFAAHPAVRHALARRNERIAAHWLRPAPAPRPHVAELAGRSVLVVDAEDTFTAMLDQLLRSLGLTVRVRRFDQPYTFAGHDLVLMGPGPGDPRHTGHPRIARLRDGVRELLGTRKPFLAVCLSHQILGSLLGFDLIRCDVPHQGAQREINLFGRPVRAGFYNTFALRCPPRMTRADTVAGTVEISRDATTGEIHALRGPFFGSMQFHAESVLTEDGLSILRDALTGLTTGARRLPSLAGT